MYGPPTKENLESFGKAWVDHLFVDFQNEKFRGEKFSWERFPNMVARLACANLKMSYDSDDDDEAELETLIVEYAKQKIATL